MATDRRNPDRRVLEIVRALKLARPHTLLAVTADGDQQRVALTGERGRYERAARTLLAYGAQLAHCLDADGQITESINVGEQPSAEDAAERARRASESSRDKDLRETMRILVEHGDKTGQRYEGILKEQGTILRQVTEASVNVMRAASERAARLEGAVLRLVLSRERELIDRERSLAKLTRQLQREAEEAGEGTDAEVVEVEGEDSLSPTMRRILTVAERAMGIPSEPDEETETKKEH